MTTRMESLRRCRCAFDYSDGFRKRDLADGWCGNQATQEDGLCDGCRAGCRGNSTQVTLTPEEALVRDGLMEQAE